MNWRNKRPRTVSADQFCLLDRVRLHIGCRDVQSSPVKIRMLIKHVLSKFILNEDFFVVSKNKMFLPNKIN